MAGESKKKIYIIDDDPLIIGLYKPRFEKSGYEIKVRNNAEGDIVGDIASFNPDLILLDVMLCSSPSDCRSGFDALEMLRIDERTKNFKVIILSNQFEDEATEKGERLGVLSYIIKAEKTPSEVVAEVEKRLLIQ